MDIHALVESQHRYYQSGATRPVEFRIEALRKASAGNTHEREAACRCVEAGFE